MSITRSKSSSDVFANGADSEMPALLTRTSGGPSSRMRLQEAAISSGFETSTEGLVDRESAQPFHPSAAKRSAIALPIPRLAPVTTTVFCFATRERLAPADGGRITQARHRA